MTAITPRMKKARVVMRPSVIVVAPRPISNGQALGPAVERAAALASNASWSIADTFESRTNTLMPASSARPTAAEINPIVPSEPSWVMP